MGVLPAASVRPGTERPGVGALPAASVRLERGPESHLAYREGGRSSSRSSLALSPLERVLVGIPPGVSELGHVTLKHLWVMGKRH